MTRPAGLLMGTIPYRLARSQKGVRLPVAIRPTASTLYVVAFLLSTGSVSF
ncbi:hypothetical protein [Spirosoma rigui]|uniref:hypothetical protein n=1 Tax=Spirosoma rigui TaxID=564064 RepID=UPI001FE416A7|nr:hypothetical protein [Spirosoma rigui]